MMLHPEVQRKGQEEISRVCDSSQLPSYDDVTAIVLEVLRWTASVPSEIVLLDTDYDVNRVYSSFSDVPHFVDTNDIYNGYLVPGGSIIIPNLWSVLLRLLNSC
jgi:hypothetical protein